MSLQTNAFPSLLYLPLYYSYTFLKGKTLPYILLIQYNMGKLCHIFLPNICCSDFLIATVTFMPREIAWTLSLILTNTNNIFKALLDVLQNFNQY